MGGDRYCGGFPTSIALLISYLIGGAPFNKIWIWLIMLTLSSACCTVYALIFALHWSDLSLNVVVPGGAGFIIGVLMTGCFPPEQAWKNVEKAAALDSVEGAKMSQISSKFSIFNEISFKIASNVFFSRNPKISF